MRKRSWIAYAVACALGWGVASTAQAQNRYYFQGPYGPGGTYNLYELKGIGDLTVNPGQQFGRYQVTNAAPLTLNTGAALSWWDAHNAAAGTTETISGTNKAAHLTSFSGATGLAENNFVHQQAFFGDVWIGLSDDPAIGVAGTAETGTGDPVADGNRGLNNATDGWRWTSGEVYDLNLFGGGEPNNCCAGGEDAAHLRGDGLWNDNGDGLDGEGVPLFKYVYEYETQSATPLNITNSIQLGSEATPTPGNKGGLGFMAIRERQSSATVSGNAGALNLLYGQLPITAEVNYQQAVINKNGLSGGAGGGNFGGDTDWGLVTEGAVAPGDINNFAFRAHGYLRVPEGQGGQYTFSVNTDDSGELWIYEKDFESVTNGSRTAYGSIAFLGDRGAGDTLGVVTLDGGKDYEFEYVMNENGGGASAELSAAKGAFTAFSGLDFKLVGGDPTSTAYAGGTTPRIASDFVIKEVLRLPDGSGPLNTLADAKALLAAPDGDDLVFNGTAGTVNHRDQTTNGSPSGRFGTGDQNFLNDTFNNPPDFDDNDFVFNAKTQIVIETAGEYTFGFDSDDGAEIILEGANFTNAFGPGVANGNAFTADLLTGSSLSAGWTFLNPGTYDLEFTMFERGGGAFAELFVAPGRAPGFSTEIFSLLSSTTATVQPRFIAGALQLGDGTWTGEPDQEGDTDGDGDVDLDDLNNVRNNFGGANPPIGDTDDDNDVDLDDLNNVRNNFGAVSGGANSVPEPSSFVLVGLGLAGLLAARKFRK